MVVHKLLQWWRAVHSSYDQSRESRKHKNLERPNTHNSIKSAQKREQRSHWKAHRGKRKIFSAVFGIEKCSSYSWEIPIVKQKAARKTLYVREAKALQESWRESERGVQRRYAAEIWGVQTKYGMLLMRPRQYAEGDNDNQVWQSWWLSY